MTHQLALGRHTSVGSTFPGNRPAPSAALTMTSLRTYIVEDSPVILENLIATLEELADVQVIGSAADESSAVKWLEKVEEPCDLMIIDIFLKGGSGLGVLRAVAQSRRHIKRVVLTNYATPEIRSKCSELGADRVFDKSNELEDLIAYCGCLADGIDLVQGSLS